MNESARFLTFIGMRRLRAGLPLAIALLLGLAACSGGGQGSEAGPTRAQYAAAVQAAADCVAEKGFEVGRLQEGPSGLLSFGISDSGEAGGSAETAFDSCWSKHAQETSDAYVSSLSLSGEAWEAEYEEFIACLERAGVEGVKVGDPEGVVGAAIGTTPENVNTEGVMCMQKHMLQLFGEEHGG